jgi:hypothetical protein
MKIMEEIKGKFYSSFKVAIMLAIEELSGRAISETMDCLAFVY